MKRKEAKQSVNITIPVSRPFRDIVEALAKRDDRKIAQFSRRILERAIAQAAQDAGLAEEAKAAGLQVA